MTISGEIIGVIVGLVTLLGLAGGLVARSAVRSARIESNQADISEVKSVLKDEIAQLKLEYAEDLRIVHGRIDRERDKQDAHVAASTEVHTALASIAASMQGFVDRLDRFEDAVNRKLETLSDRFNRAGTSS